jgi:hypothetical protein
VDVRRSRLLLFPLLGAAALIAVVALAGARTDAGTPFTRVAANPERFLGEEVRVTGRITARPNRDELLVLEGAEGRRLLLVPPDDARLAIGVRVAVRGRVELLVSPAAASAGTSALVRARELAVRAG